MVIEQLLTIREGKGKNKDSHSDKVASMLMQYPLSPETLDKEFLNNHQRKINGQNIATYHHPNDGLT